MFMLERMHKLKIPEVLKQKIRMSFQIEEGMMTRMMTLHMHSFAQ